MKIFDLFKKSSGLPSTQPEIVILEGEDDLEIVGESYQQKNILSLVKGETKDRLREEVIGYLIPEPENQYDPNAIGVWINGKKVGFVAKEIARDINDDLVKLMRLNEGRYIGLRGVIAGGGERDNSSNFLGVFLEYPSDQFGVNTREVDTAKVPEFSMSTGRSDAFLTDQQDESYDLSWFNRLSADPTKRISELKSVLIHNLEPISRHFAYAELEEILYHYKEVIPDALSVYDQISEKHSEELESSIRSALISKWGKLPNLVVFRQTSIRYAKAKNLEKALEWANRGLEVYADDSLKEEWILDLKKRVVTLEARIVKQKDKK